MTAAVVTSHPLAVEAGIEALRRGGTAADAAVAVGAVLAVVDPRSTGIGGDLYAQYWSRRAARPVVLTGTGISPAGLDIDALRHAGFRSMPTHGPWAVTVPGVPAAWGELLSRFGKLSLGDALELAIAHALDGFEVTPVVAEEWALSSPTLLLSEAASRCYLPEGRPPRAGERFRNPDLAALLQRLLNDGLDAFYRGDIAERIVRAVSEAGGPLTVDDMESWNGPMWEEPLSIEYRGYEIFEAPLPSQGIVVLEALQLFEGFDCITDDATRTHLSVECVKLAFQDAYLHIGDPRCSSMTADELLDSQRLAEMRSRLSISTAAAAQVGASSDTVYAAIVDHEGNCCSFIQSLYHGFGSGVAVPGTGILLQNRGAGFTFISGHPNMPAPGKRPYHTIIPAMIGRHRRPWAILGVVGGYMQPQGQFQIVTNMVDLGFQAADAVASPRFRALGGTRLGVESGFDLSVIGSLERRGHTVEALSGFQAGGAQLIVLEDESVIGATDPRKDGTVGRMG